MSELTFQDPKKKFCEELRAAREYKGLDLSRVSEKSKISQPYLEKLEEGDWDFLPHPYVRSFLRTYALIVGLEVGKVLEQFDNIVDEPPVPVPGVFESEEGIPIRDNRPKKPAKKKKDAESDESRKPLKFTLAGEAAQSTQSVSRGSSRSSKGSGNNMAWMIGAVVIILVIASIFLWPDNEDKPPVEEIPFEEVVAQHEEDVSGQTQQPAETHSAPTQSTPQPQQNTTQPEESTSQPIEEGSEPVEESNEPIATGIDTTGNDTLVTGILPGERIQLFAEALDKCYIRVTVDGDTVPLSDIVLDSGMTRQYEADSLFTVVLGNAAGMKLTLGEAALGELGEEGRVVTVFVGRDGIQRIRRGVLRRPEPQTPNLDTLDLTRPVGQARDRVNGEGDTMNAELVSTQLDSGMVETDTTTAVDDTSATQ